VPVERDQRVGVELGQCDVFGVIGIGPAEQDGGLSGDVLQDAVPEQPDRNPRTCSSCRSASFLVPRQGPFGPFVALSGIATWRASSTVGQLPRR